MLPLDADVRKALWNASEAFAPAWKRFDAGGESDIGKYDPLNFRWGNKIPITNPDIEPMHGWYLGQVSVFVTGNSDGSPAPDGTRANLVTVCQGSGYTVMTRDRILMRVVDGDWFDGQLPANKAIIASLRREDILSASVATQGRMFGGAKVGRTVLQVAGPNLAVVVLQPVRGVNGPYGAKPSYWGKNVQATCFSDVVRTMTGTKPTELSQTTIIAPGASAERLEAVRGLEVR